MFLTKNGRGVSGIVLPPVPTARERFAAEELTDYVRKISGAELTCGENEPYTVYIGDPSRNPAAAEWLSEEEFDRLVPGPEGIMILASEDKLLLAGSSRNPGERERGTVYAVYELLERVFGCSFAAYGKSGTDTGEWIPSMKTMEIAPFRYVKAAAHLSYRTAIVQYDVWVGDPDHPLNPQFISWLAKNRYNRILTWSGIYEGFKSNGMLEEAEKRGIAFSVGHHQSFTMLIPPHGNAYFSEEYEKTHPEYFRLLEDGSRYTVRDGDFTGQLTLCMRNEALIGQMADNIVRWADENPAVDVICLWPQDGCHPQCCCAACSAHSKSENYTYFVSSVAERVSEKRPLLRIDRIAYVDLLECGEEKLSRSLIVDEAVWFDSGLRSVGRPDGGSFADSPYETTLLRWKRAGAQVVYYDYLMGIYGCRQKWLPAADEIQASCRRMTEKGILGSGTQLEAFNLWNHAFNFYSFARTAYDGSLSFEEALAAFCRLFGEGSPYVADVIRHGEAVLDGQVTIRYAADYVMEHVDLPLVYGLYEKALNAAKSPRARNNIRLMRMAFRYSDLEAHNPRYTDTDTGKVSNAADDSGELWYMHTHFDSFLSGNEGYGIAIPVTKQNKHEFCPDVWYQFE